MLWLGAREETRIVVACHSGFLLNVFNSAIEFPSQGVADSREQSWFETGIGHSFQPPIPYSLLLDIFGAIKTPKLVLNF